MGPANRRSSSSGRRIRPSCWRNGSEPSANLHAETRFPHAKINVRHDNSDVYDVNTHIGPATWRCRSSGKRIRPFCRQNGTELSENLETEIHFLHAKTNIRNDNS